MDFKNILALSWAGNTVAQYFYAFGLFVFLQVAIKPAIRKVLQFSAQKVQRSQTDIDDKLVNAFRHLSSLVYLPVSLYISTQFLGMHDLLQRILMFIFLLSVLYFVIVVTRVVLQHIIDQQLNEELGKKVRKSVMNAIQSITHVVLWIIGISLILSNVGINIVPVIASMGIASIGIALAAQKVLGDLISGVILLTEASIKLGDYVVVGDAKGNVVHIGLRSTRLLAVGGEMIVVPNKQIIEVILTNHQERQIRKKVFTFGVDLNTSTESLSQLGSRLKKRISEITINKQYQVTVGRCHFKEISNYAFIFQVVFDIKTPDFSVYVEAEELVNLKVLEVLNEMAIKIAQPKTISLT